MFPVKRILWPSDASESANRALDVAIEVAKQFGAKLYGLQVVTEVPTLTDTGPPMSGINIPRYEEELRQGAQEALEEMIKATVPDDIEVETFIEMGKPVEVIITFAKEKGIDLIVMATHGRSGLSHLFIGSVAENVIRYSPIPTLIIPEKSGKKDEPR
jgi:nucleotide-binding universal stress UspA family protein